MKLEEVKKLAEAPRHSEILPIEIRYKGPGGIVTKRYNPEAGTWTRKYKSLGVTRDWIGRLDHIVTRGSIVTFERITTGYVDSIVTGSATRLGYFLEFECPDESAPRFKPYVSVAYGLDRNSTAMGMESIDHRIKDIDLIRILKREYTRFNIEEPPPLKERIEMRWFGVPTITVPGYFMGLDKTSIKIARYLDENSEPRKIEEFPIKEIGELVFLDLLN